MPESEFWRADLRSVINRIQGAMEIEQQRQEIEWERVRWQTAALLSPHAKKGQRIKPADLVKFPWEETARRASPEELEVIFSEMDSAMRKHLKKQGNG